uniref:Uncharacterized protein n=1 Tax=Anguilla anguilla TaxID=7936 RepID=A0A0E9PRT7_ANGAN
MYVLTITIKTFQTYLLIYSIYSTFFIIQFYLNFIHLFYLNIL